MWLSFEVGDLNEPRIAFELHLALDTVHVMIGKCGMKAYSNISSYPRVVEDSSYRMYLTSRVEIKFLSNTGSNAGLLPQTSTFHALAGHTGTVPGAL